MSNTTHYLLNYANPIATSRITDVVQPDISGKSDIGSNFVVRAPAGGLSNPTNLTDLITQKYQSLLAANPGYQYIAYDDMLDGSGVDASVSFTSLGERGTVSILPWRLVGGDWIASSLLTQGVLLSDTPSKVMLIWEAFEYEIDQSTGRVIRRYCEVDPNTAASARVYFDGDLDGTPASSGAVTFIAPEKRGDTMKLRLISSGSYADKPLWVGSWAVIY